MEIVSSCNHRYTARDAERENSLGAYRFECAPRQGKRCTSVPATIGLGRYASFFACFLPLCLALDPLSILPLLCPRHRIRETVLSAAAVTVRFSDTARSFTAQESAAGRGDILRQKFVPRSIRIHRFSSVRAGSLRGLVPRSPNVDFRRNAVTTENRCSTRNVSVS